MYGGCYILIIMCCEKFSQWFCSGLLRNGLFRVRPQRLVFHVRDGTITTPYGDR